MVHWLLFLGGVTTPQVEFEWLRQFWMQGSRHAAERKSWEPAMEELEADWNKMEHMVKAVPVRKF